MGKETKISDIIISPIVRLLKKLFRALRNIIILFVVFAVLLVVLFKFINPRSNYYMVSERIRLGYIERDWVSLGDFPVHVPRSLVAAEDANFCVHSGFDFASIKSALNGTGKVRGASTISQQVAKNVFLWPNRSWLRKGMEAGFTILIELIWTKSRILEVYINIAEFDEGVFGIAAAGRHYFSVEPSRINRLQAARLAAVLPNPKKRSANHPTADLRKRTRQILSGEETIAVDGRANCFSQDLVK